MKKLFVGVVAAFMMAASLVAVSGASVTAAPGKRCGYSACIPTDTQLRAFSPKPRKLKAIASVSAGNITVNKGSIKVRVKGNDKYRQKVRSAPKAKVSFKLPPGVYLVEAKYRPMQSRFRRSDEATIVTVRGRRR